MKNYECENCDEVFPEASAHLDHFEGKECLSCPYCNSSDVSETSKKISEFYKVSMEKELLETLKYLLSSYRADFKLITGSTLNNTEAVKKAVEVINKGNSMNEIKNSYLNGTCPDCNIPIPNDVSNGESCSNCSHAFYEEHPDTCHLCGESFFITETGIFHHGENDNIDYNLDADHVAYGV